MLIGTTTTTTIKYCVTASLYIYMQLCPQLKVGGGGLQRVIFVVVNKQSETKYTYTKHFNSSSPILFGICDDEPKIRDNCSNLSTSAHILNLSHPLGQPGRSGEVVVVVRKAQETTDAIQSTSCNSSPTGSGEARALFHTRSLAGFSTEQDILINILFCGTK